MKEVFPAKNPTVGYISWCQVATSTQSHFDHIQISTKVTTEKRNLGTKMALMKIMQTAIIGLCLVTLLGAFPQISLETTTLGPLEENCHYEDQNITEIVQEEKLEKKCKLEKK